MQNYLFDFDGTIADSGDAAILATQACFKDYGLEIPSDKAVRYYRGVPIETYIPELVEKQGEHYSDKQFAEMYDNFRKHYQKIEQRTTVIFDGMKSTLAQLKANGKKLFIISSKSSLSLQRNVKTLGLDKYFVDLVGSDQVENYKPSPDGVLVITDRYDLDKNESVMIGDAKYDLQMGKAARVHTCGCLWDTFDEELLRAEHPDYLLRHPEQLLDI